MTDPIRLNPTTIEIIVGLHIFFDDYEKICHWLMAKNIELGDMSPIQLIRNGRDEKVLKYINSKLEDGEYEL